MEALVFDIKRFAIHDGPGIRTTFFLKGCPLHCLWCQNPESISPRQELLFTTVKCTGCGACAGACSHLRTGPLLPREDCTLCGKCVAVCPTGARRLAARPMTPDAVAAAAAEDRAFYRRSGGGVTFSGGECLTHAAFLAETLRLCRAQGLHTAVDTCGFVPWDCFAKVLPHTDLFLYDLKLMDPVRHRQYTGKDNRRILANLARLAALGRELILRIPLIPGHTDAPEDIAAAGRFIRNVLGGRVRLVELLPYNQLAESKYGNHTAYPDGGLGPYPLPGLAAQDREALQGLLNILLEMGLPARSEAL